MANSKRATFTLSKTQLMLGAVGFAFIGMVASTSIGFLLSSDVIVKPAHATQVFWEKRTNGKQIACAGCHATNPTAAGYVFAEKELTSCGKGFIIIAINYESRTLELTRHG